MNQSRTIYEAGSTVSPAISDGSRTWFLGRETTSACAEGLKGVSPSRKSDSATWFLGRKARSE